MNRLCQCGCGQPAPIAWRTNNGYRKRDVMRFLPNHYKVSADRSEMLKRRARLGDTLAERWEKHVDKKGPVIKSELGPCWIWKLRIESTGYGYLMAFGRREGAHRAAYRIFKGPIPVGFQIDHLCRNRSCVNPDHLEAVTLTENVLRGEGVTARNKNTTHCIHGHEFTPENTRIYRRGKKITRRCLACRDEHSKRYWHEITKPRKEARRNGNRSVSPAIS